MEIHNFGIDLQGFYGKNHVGNQSNQGDEKEKVGSNYSIMI